MKSRSSDFEIVLPISPYRPEAEQWLTEIFVPRYSGATARDSHPFPYSPPTVIRGTFS
jgi:hypothetical protein